MSDSKVSALTAAPTPLDEDWLLKLSKGTPDNLDRRATLAQVRGEAGFGLARTNGIWVARSPYGDPNAIVMESDFLGDATTPFSRTWGGSGAAVEALSNTTLGFGGACNARTGSTSTGYAGLIWPVPNPAANNNMWFGEGAWSMEARIRLPDLSDGTNAYGVRMGFLTDPCFSSAPGNGAYFIYEPATYGDQIWRAVSRNSNTDRTVDSGVSASNSAWQTLLIEVAADGSSIVSSINGSVVDTNTTNIPTGNAKRFGYGIGIRKTAGTSERFLYIDYFRVIGRFPSGRPA